MRKEMIDGKLGSVEFFNAVLQGSEGVEKRFSALPPRISIATNAFTLAWAEYVNGTDEAINITSMIANGIIVLSNHIPELVGGVVTLTSAWVGYKSVGIATALYDGAKAMLAFNVAMTANPIGLVVAGIAALSAGLYFFSDDIKVTEDGMVSLQDVFVVGWDAISGAVSDAVSVMTSLWDNWGGDFRAVAGEAYDFVMNGFSGLVDFYKNGWNAAIGIFVGAYKSIVDIWSNFAPALADIVLSAVNNALSIIEGFVNQSIAYVNYAIQKANALSSGFGMGSLVPEIGNVDLGQIENQFAGAGANLGKSIMSNFEGALDTNYLGAISDKFSGMADDVLAKAREVAEARKGAGGVSLGGGDGGGGGVSPVLATGLDGGAGGSRKTSGDEKAEAEKALRERLALEEEFARMRADMVTNEYDRELAQEALAQQKRLETIAEFNAKGIGTQAERQALLIASEEIYSAKILEIEAQREQAKIDLQNEFRQFRAEGMAEELAMNLELETLAYEERLAKLEEFNNELILSDQELAELKEAELASHQARVAELEKKDAERKKKLEEETYKATFGAKLAYAMKAKGLAKALSSDEAKAFAGGLEESMDAFAQHSKGMFEAQKALSVAKAVMAGYEAAIGAYAYGSALGGPALGAVFAGIAVASTAAQIAGIMSSQYSGGRKQGGSVSQNSMYRVAENNRPELLTMGGNTYLMTGSQGGTVTPNNKIPEFMMPKMGGGGSVTPQSTSPTMVNITIKNEVAGVVFEENRISAGEVEIICRRVTREETPRIVQNELSNPNSRSARSMQNNFKVERKR
jgi:SLT domain-containing protein